MPIPSSLPFAGRHLRRLIVSTVGLLAVAMMPAQAQELNALV